MDVLEGNFLGQPQDSHTTGRGFFTKQMGDFVTK